jgi:hypothetical protein
MPPAAPLALLVDSAKWIFSGMAPAMLLAAHTVQVERGWGPGDLSM